MSNEYELCIAEMKKQHEIRLKLVETENTVLKLHIEGQRRTLDLLKAAEDQRRITRNLQAIGEEDSIRTRGGKYNDLLLQLKEEHALSVEMKQELESWRNLVEAEASSFQSKFAHLRSQTRQVKITTREPAAASVSGVQLPVADILPTIQQATTNNDTTEQCEEQSTRSRSKVIVISVGKEVTKMGIALKSALCETHAVVTAIRPTSILKDWIKIGDKLHSINGIKVTGSDDMGQFAGQDKLLKFELAEENPSTAPSPHVATDILHTLEPQAQASIHTHTAPLSRLIEECDQHFFGGAYHYVESIKLKFIEHPAVYAMFLRIVENFQSNVIGIEEAAAQIFILLRGFNDLILGFNVMLPDEFKIILKDNEPVMIRSVVSEEQTLVQSARGVPVHDHMST